MQCTIYDGRCRHVLALVRCLICHTKLVYMHATTALDPKRPPCILCLESLEEGSNILHLAALGGLDRACDLLLQRGVRPQPAGLPRAAGTQFLRP